ncbi:hypothetical protein [Thalassospira sp.]|uniref:hypothetical protein n=1 Tax=Thalassospira sp. TaxID=1912094 RepID=UPI000C577B15|nr:hypothetical protein [Thalassospira sp.]MBC07469.1 hypothetical protein [Thalassospira sp.]|tara:strand:+ start:962 stop:2518 length:1557 start_codon:yes stop_codon:yes gene_type:complete
MVGAVHNNPNANINALQAHDAGANAAPDQNDGIVARGVGMLQKAWLQVTGQASSTHSRQLTNLKAQVSREFGEGGLKVLNDKLSAKKWDSPNSTKMFSTSELNSLRKDAKDGAGLAAFKMDIHREMAAKRAEPELAANAAQLDRNEKIEARIPYLLENRSDELIDALIEGPAVSRFEAIQGTQTVSNAANQVIGDPSISFMMNYALPYLKLDPTRDITPDMITDMIGIAERHCVPDAMQEVTLPDQELDGLMKEAMAGSLGELTNVAQNGSDSEKVAAIREFLTGNLQDFFAHASDMYFDRLDNAPSETLLTFTRAAHSALPDLARAEAAREVDADKATLVAAERAPIEQNLRANLADRRSYPEVDSAIIDIELTSARSALAAGVDHPRGEQLDLIDQIARYSSDTDSPSPYMLDELGNLANSILDDDAPWADQIPAAERDLIQQRAGEMEAAGNGDDYDKRVAASNFLNTLESVNQVISNNYYQNHLANDPTFSKALNAEATNVVNKQIRDERNAAN